MNEMNCKKPLISEYGIWGRHSKLFINCHVSWDTLYYPIRYKNFYNHRKSNRICKLSNKHHAMWNSLFWVRENTPHLFSSGNKLRHNSPLFRPDKPFFRPALFSFFSFFYSNFEPHHVVYNGLKYFILFF